MEISEQQEKKKTEVKAVNVVNAIALLFILIVSQANDNGGLIAFSIGALFGAGNFFAMIVYIARKDVPSLVSCIIWMLMMPIIGFGCCAASINFSN